MRGRGFWVFILTTGALLFAACVGSPPIPTPTKTTPSTATPTLAHTPSPITQPIFTVWADEAPASYVRLPQEHQWMMDGLSKGLDLAWKLGLAEAKATRKTLLWGALHSECPEVIHEKLAQEAWKNFIQKTSKAYAKALVDQLSEVLKSERTGHEDPRWLVDVGGLQAGVDELLTHIMSEIVEATFDSIELGLTREECKRPGLDVRGTIRSVVTADLSAGLIQTHEAVVESCAAIPQVLTYVCGRPWLKDTIPINVRIGWLFEWQSVTGTKRYQLQIYELRDDQRLYPLDLNEAGTFVSDTQYLLRGNQLKLGTLYYWRVAALFDAYVTPFNDRTEHGVVSAFRLVEGGLPQLPPVGFTPPLSAPLPPLSVPFPPIPGPRPIPVRPPWIPPVPVH